MTLSCDIRCRSVARLQKNIAGDSPFEGHKPPTKNVILGAEEGQGRTVDIRADSIQYLLHNAR
jgi:hypothetical protein